MEVKSLAEAPAIADAVPFEIDEGALALRDRARRFAEDVLMPLEEEAERRGGVLGDELVDLERDRVCDGRRLGERLDLHRLDRLTCD